MGPPASGPTLRLIEAPTRLELRAEDLERAPFLKISDRQNRELITAIELLSPSDKRPGSGRDKYLAKRPELLAVPTHLGEIELLRGGRPMPLVRRTPCDYSIPVGRAEQRLEAGFWPFRLRQQLPEIPSRCGCGTRAPASTCKVYYTTSMTRRAMNTSFTRDRRTRRLRKMTKSGRDSWCRFSSRTPVRP